MSTRTAFRSAFGPLTGIVLFLAACVPVENGRTTLPINDFQPQSVRVSRDIVFPPGATSLSPANTEQIADFVRRLGARPSDELAVIGHGPLGFLRAQAVQSSLTGFGLESRQVDLSTSPRDVVTVTLSRSVQLPSACVQGNDILYDRSGGVSVLPHPRCSTDMNLARMIADPDDLVRGRTLGPAEGVFTQPPVETYRQGEAAEEPELIEEL